MGGLYIVVLLHLNTITIISSYCRVILKAVCNIILLMALDKLVLTLPNYSIGENVNFSDAKLMY